MSVKKIKIIIADDHPIVIQGLQTLLQERSAYKIVGCYANGYQLLKGIKENKPDMVITDIKLPDIHGEQLLNQICKKFPATKILVLTYLDNIYYVKAMMRNGASGYVLKTSSQEVILEAIETIARGEQYIEEKIKTMLVDYMLTSKKQSKEIPLLTKREKEVLQLIATSLTSQQIADKLFLSLKTVEFHRSNLLFKLKAKNAAALVKKAMQMNFIE